MRIVVVGAGLAGLTAAHELAAAGAAITLVDARDRIGGRVWTVRDRFAEVSMVNWAARTRVRSSGPRAARRISRQSIGSVDVLSDVLNPLIRRYQAAGGRDDAAAVREMATWSLGEWLRREDGRGEARAMAVILREVKALAQTAGRVVVHVPPRVVANDGAYDPAPFLRLANQGVGARAPGHRRFSGGSVMCSFMVDHELCHRVHSGESSVERPLLEFDGECQLRSRLGFP